MIIPTEGAAFRMPSVIRVLGNNDEHWSMVRMFTDLGQVIGVGLEGPHLKKEEVKKNKER